MEKVWLKDVDYDSSFEINPKHNKDRSKIYLLGNGSYLKIFSYKKIKDSNIKIEKADFSLEDKIVLADLCDIDEIVKPKAAVYADQDKTKFKGYIMDQVRGVNYVPETIAVKSEDTLNLYRYARIYQKLEEAVKRANEKGIVIPDLCTIGNIILTSSSGDIRLIDYDGMQIGNHGTFDIAGVYNKERDGFTSKYRQNHLYTANLDKKSLMLLYLYNTFDIPCTKIDALTEDGKDATNLIKYLGIEDPEMQYKLYRFYSKNGDNEYLGATVFKLADNYELSRKSYDKKILVNKRNTR